MELSNQSIERLDKLVWLMEHFKQELEVINHGVTSFNLKHWWAKDNCDATIKDHQDMGYDCGTTACAVGAAMLHPWFNERGLIATFDGGFGAPCIRNNNSAGSDFDAAAAFFGLNFDQAVSLFSPSSYPTHHLNSPQAVADKVRKFVKEHSPIVTFTVEVVQESDLETIAKALFMADRYEGTLECIKRTCNDFLDFTFVSTVKAGRDIAAEMWNVGFPDMSVDWPEELL